VFSLAKPSRLVTKRYSHSKPYALYLCPSLSSYTFHCSGYT
jgi:hypothetical protein